MLIRWGPQLASQSFKVGERTVSLDFMRSGAHTHTSEMTMEESIAVASWFKALFDSGSEGIEDTILR